MQFMCGIFGAINFRGFFGEKDYGCFVKQTDLVSYRGPDASGYKTINLASGTYDKTKFNVFLGHRRLSIIELSEAGNQPFTDSHGLWITYNGEVFNYIELREELKEKGYAFKSNTDTEVILKLYSEYGESGFSRLNGMWAFGLVNIPERKIILSRDRFSIKPLYYTQAENKFYFASEIKQILPFVREKEVNESTMFKFLKQGLIDYNTETFFRYIYKLEPKCNLIIQPDTGKNNISQYWDYSIEDEGHRQSLPEIAERFHALLKDSVRIRLRSDVKVGGLLSGGLDSSSISVLSNSLQQGGFYTFSVISKNKKYTEEKYIDILSKNSSIHNTKMSFDFEEVSMGDIEKVIYYNDEPFGGFSVIAHYKILEELKKNSDIKVVLSGQGGDEILMGYLKYFFFNIKKLIETGHFIDALTQFCSSLIKRTVVWQFKITEARRYLPFLAKKSDKPFLKVQGKLEPIWDANDLRKRQILDIDKYSVPALAHYEDRNSMAHSLEIRLPFLDHRLVNYVLNLPIDLKLNKGWTKYVLRRGLYELPDAIRWRRDKQGFIIPEKVWLKKNFSQLINDIFDGSMLDKLGIISEKSFLKYYREFQYGKMQRWYADISRTLIAELWARRLF